MGRHLVLVLALAACSPTMLEPTFADHYEVTRTRCVDVPEDVSPLDHLGVEAARPIAEFGGRPRLRRTHGARVFVEGRTGWTAARLQQWTECHIARTALLLPEERAPHDPLAVEGVRAEVRVSGVGYELWLTADRERGAEVNRRAQALVAD